MPVIKFLYEGEGFQIIDVDGETVFSINSEAREISYSFLKNAIDEYERYKSKSS